MLVERGKQRFDEVPFVAGVGSQDSARLTAAFAVACAATVLHSLGDAAVAGGVGPEGVDCTGICQLH